MRVRKMARRRRHSPPPFESLFPRLRVAVFRICLRRVVVEINNRYHGWYGTIPRSTVGHIEQYNYSLQQQY